MTSGSDVSDSGVRYDVRGRVAVIAVDRPERRNAWSVPVYRAVVAAVRRTNEDDVVGAMVLTAAGGVYSAGVDMKAPPEPRDESGRRPNVGSLAMDPEHGWPHLMRDSKPVVAAVNGPAVGLGVTHLLAADIRIAARSATFSFPFLRLGTLPELGCSALLPQIVGVGRALDLCLRARTIDAVEAERIGLVTAVVADEDLQTEAVGVAGSMADFPRLQVGLTKRMFRDDALEGDLGAVLRTESRAFVELLKRRGGSAGPRG